MEEFMANKNTEILEPLKKYQSDVENHLLPVTKYKDYTFVLSDLFDELTHTTWKKLMEAEMQLYTQIQECNQTFERAINEMINTFIEAAQAQFTQIRNLEQTYLENISEYSSRALTLATVSGESNWPQECDWVKPIIRF